ncbi:hypothetical protein [uncultured Clostridium sp.]|uniref:hypothetical protein n=1 Tax=uncultured Clostridium sp. TaxID=59620 RepID=UPI0028EF0FC2|nr:hypothetical protein [uncultured Clostridium sp.]
MDIKLKDIFKCIRTYQVVRIKENNTGESFYPNYSDIADYAEYFVTEIQSEDDKLVVYIQETI